MASVSGWASFLSVLPWEKMRENEESETQPVFCQALRWRPAAGAVLIELSRITKAQNSTAL